MIGQVAWWLFLAFYSVCTVYIIENESSLMIKFLTIVVLLAALSKWRDDFKQWFKKGKNDQ